MELVAYPVIATLVIVLLSQICLLYTSPSPRD